jgi:hypothetical protein
MEKVVDATAASVPGSEVGRRKPADSLLYLPSRRAPGQVVADGVAASGACD